MLFAKVNFSKKLREWDGFGINYVECCQTIDYKKEPQEYGGFSTLSEVDRQTILDMIFGEDGLKVGVLKMFLDSLHQGEDNQNKPDPNHIDLSNYDHENTTRWMRYFAREGLKKTRKWGGDLEIITTLYGPPGWMTKQKFVRGRDLDPKYKLECAKYMISWAKYLREVEGLPVKYISLHNEGEDYHRWNYDGSNSGIEQGNDYNLWWKPEMVAEFIKMMRPVLDANGMKDVGVSPGETSNWLRFYDWGYAEGIADDAEALKNLGIITSHGFHGYDHNRWFSDHRSLGADLLREKRPELHSWVTSASWSKMDPWFPFEVYCNIYSAKINAFIPWAVVQWTGKWRGGDPNPGTGFNVNGDGTYKVQTGYYYYKQLTRAGQPGMAVASTNVTETGVAIIGFAKNGTSNSDAFVVINALDKEYSTEIIIEGSDSIRFKAYRTSDDERYADVGCFEVVDGVIKYIVPANSVTTFFGKMV